MNDDQKEHLKAWLSILFWMLILILFIYLFYYKIPYTIATSDLPDWYKYFLLRRHD